MNFKFPSYIIICLLLIFLLAKWSFLKDRARNTYQKITRIERLSSVKKKVLNQLKKELEEKNLKLGAPVFLRIFKESSELELWVLRNGNYELFKNYPICYWSGNLGPKLKEGDKQSPEGFYRIGKNQLNPLSSYHLSFNIGYPNKLDILNNRTGSSIMIHGDCVSRGCYAMTNNLIEEIYILVESSIKETGKEVHVHSFPFRMTSENINIHKDSKWTDFWKNLKNVYDYFEREKKVPNIRVVDKRYHI